MIIRKILGRSLGSNPSYAPRSIPQKALRNQGFFFALFCIVVQPIIMMIRKNWEGRWGRIPATRPGLRDPVHTAKSSEKSGLFFALFCIVVQPIIMIIRKILGRSLGSNPSYAPRSIPQKALRNQGFFFALFCVVVQPIIMMFRKILGRSLGSNPSYAPRSTRLDPYRKKL